MNLHIPQAMLWARITGFIDRLETCDRKLNLHPNSTDGSPVMVVPIDWTMDKDATQSPSDVYFENLERKMVELVFPGDLKSFVELRWQLKGEDWLFEARLFHLMDSANPEYSVQHLLDVSLHYVHPDLTPKGYVTYIPRQAECSLDGAEFRQVNESMRAFVAQFFDPLIVPVPRE